MASELEYGARSPRVRTLQSALVQLGQAIGVDGIYGTETAGAVTAFARARADTRLPKWLEDGILAEAAAIAQPALRSIGAWCRRASLDKADEMVTFAYKTKLDRLDVVVNDHSAWRSPTAFDTFALPKIEGFCMRARDRGLKVHLMSWIMPHGDYIDRAADVLIPLCQRIGASSLQWDAEEPWTKARYALAYDAAAARIKQAFAGLGCPMGANAIGQTPIAKFAPLAAICDYVVPQAYATATSGLAPQLAAGKYHLRFKQAFGRPIVVGLAAYGQSGIANHTSGSAITAALAGAAAIAEVDTVIFWSLDAIRRASSVAAAIHAAPRRT